MLNGMTQGRMGYKEEWEYVRERIIELRKARGFSIQVLADVADMERSSLSRLESGKANGISFGTICKIAEALGVAPGELVRKS